MLCKHTVTYEYIIIKQWILHLKFSFHKCLKQTFIECLNVLQNGYISFTCQITHFRENRNDCLLLRVSWTAKRSNQSILKEISPEYSLEGLMLKLKLQYFGHLMQRTDSLERPWCWEKLNVGGEGDNRGWDGWMASPTQWTWVWVNSGVGDGLGNLACCSSWGHKESDTTESLNWLFFQCFPNDGIIV